MIPHAIARSKQKKESTDTAAFANPWPKRLVPSALRHRIPFVGADCIRIAPPFQVESQRITSQKPPQPVRKPRGF